MWLRRDASAASRAGSFPDGFVPGAADRADQVGPAELAPQLRHVDVHRPRAAVVGHAPDAVEELLAREDDAGVLEQPGEEVELLRRQLDRLAGDLDLPSVAAHLDVAELERLLLRAVLDAAQARIDPRGEL